MNSGAPTHQLAKTGELERIPTSSNHIFRVMPALVAGIHVLLSFSTEEQARPRRGGRRSNRTGIRTQSHLL